MNPVLSFNNLSLKEINRHKLFAAIYRTPNQTKLQLSRVLDQSLSTIDNNIKSLLDENMITTSGLLASTGGRKATGYIINERHKLALGLFINKTDVIICATDLNGEIIASGTIAQPYQQNDEYFVELARQVQDFIAKENLDEQIILGIALAIQGVVAPDGKSVNYGPILKNNGLVLENIQKHFKLPCSLHHDSKAAAFAQLWEQPSLTNAALYLLNENFGGALIIAKMVHYGTNSFGGLIEHLKVGTEHRKCYCGDEDCLECYCSQSSLEGLTHLKVQDFFHKLRNLPLSTKSTLKGIWTSYLEHLSYAIRQNNKLVDGKIILTGSVAPFLNDDDHQRILELCNRDNGFPIAKGDLIVSPQNDSVVALGAARYLINTYLSYFDANPIQDPKYNKSTLTLNVAESN